MSAGVAPADVSRLTEALRDAAAAHPRNEAAFRKDAEAAIERTAAAVGVELRPEVEFTIAGAGFADAVYNRFVIEWEAPGALRGTRGHGGNRHAVGQLRGYLERLAEQERHPVERYGSVACDGHFLIFARFRAGFWVVDEPVPLDEYSIRELLDGLLAARSLRALTARNVLHDFGPETLIARRCASALLDQLDAKISQEPDGFADRLYRQWERNFAVATGVTGDKLDSAARTALAKVFGRTASELDPAHGLFALQTYFAIVTKLIASIALSVFVPDSDWDIDSVASAREAELCDALRQLEHGEPFRRAGLRNVIEPDVFAWYLDGWKPAVSDLLPEVMEILGSYDPTTLEVSREHARDLLKDLYQGLLPRPVRHALGQYFTPDWLAAHVLDEVKYAGDPDLRLIDPACGTGTFLVLAIARLRETLRRQRVEDPDALKQVLANVVAFDIDPLAVVAARTNYVLALGPLLRHLADAPADVPVYLADSIVVPASADDLLRGERLELDTTGGTFSLPTCIDSEAELRDVCDLASRGVQESWDRARFIGEAATLCDANDAELGVLGDFFDACAEQHAKGLDGLWPLIMRNAFMPAFVGRFDLVVGNPPWVNWEHLPAPYRERTLPIWAESGLFVHGGMEAMLGAGKKDVAMLMSYVASERLLRENGTLGFVMTQTVFKTAGAGQGFRGFQVGESGRIPVRIEQVDDMVDLQPFAGASNRTAVMTWRRDAPTRYPVRYRLWRRTGPGRIPQDAVPELLVDATRAVPLVAAPVRGDDRTSAWLTAPRSLVPALRRLAAGDGPPPYVAHEGVNSGGANGIYWVEAEGEPDVNGLVPIRNLFDIGRRVLAQRYGRVEHELLHPLIRGRDISRWAAVPSAEILFVQDPGTRRGIAEETMREKYPGALAYLRQFETELRARAAFKRFYTRLVGGARSDSGPFWSMFNVGPYTAKRHRVVWKDQSAVFAAAVLPVSGPVPLPNHKSMLVACDSADEAHYLCGLLNSLPVRAFVASYTIETQISTHVVANIAIPRFDRTQPAHKALASASKSSHRAAASGRRVDERAVDAAAASIWAIESSELGSMSRYLDRIGRNLADAPASEDGDD